PDPLPLQRLLVQQRLDAYAPGLGPEVPPERVGAREPPPAPPLGARLEVALAHELLLARVQALVPLAVVLTRERLAAHRAHEGPLIRVCPQVRAQVVRAGEALGAERALEG